MIPIFAFIVVSLMGCQTKGGMHIQDPRVPVVKRDAQTLSLSLKIEDYISPDRQYTGLQLHPTIDPHASYMYVEICSQTACSQGHYDGLMSEVLYAAPEGVIDVRYRACLLEYRAIGEPCGPVQTTTFARKLGNKAPLFLALTGERLSREKRLKVLNSMFEDIDLYLQKSEREGDFERCLENLYAWDSTVLLRWIDSKTFDAQRRKWGEQLPQSLALSVLSLGSPRMGSEFFVRWREEKAGAYSESYAEALEEQLKSGKKVYDLEMELKHLTEEQKDLLSKMNRQLSLL